MPTSSITSSATSPWRTASARWPPGRASRGPRWRWVGCSASPTSTSPIVGATKIQHIEDAVAALEVTLSADDVTALEELYQPKRVAGL